MADDQKEADEEVEGEVVEKKSKKGLFLGVGMLLLVVVGYVGATMGVPDVEPVPQYQGPFVVDFTPAKEKLQINLKSDGNDVLLLTIGADFDAYVSGELEARLEDPRFHAYLVNRLIQLGSSKSPDDLVGTDSIDAFLLEVRDAVDPICFPVHIGDSSDALEIHADSGLKAGDSTFNSTLRGRFYDHKLYVNGPDKTLRLDEGEVIAYHGDEVDLVVTNAEGHFIFINVTNANPDFIGELNVGVKGRLRKILRGFFYVQKG